MILLCFYLLTDKAKKDRKQKILAITNHGHCSTKPVTTTVSESVSIPSLSTTTTPASVNVGQTSSSTSAVVLSDSEDMDISSTESGKLMHSSYLQVQVVNLCI